jgi:hypothetical protein
VNESFEYFTISHWQSLQTRLILPISHQYFNDRATIQRPSFQCSPSSSSPLSGIIAHLTSKFGGNVHDRNVVNITANRVVGDSPSYAPRNVADLGGDSLFHSVNEPNQSICFDFKKMKVIPTHYSVRTYNYNPGGHHLKNWVIEGSVDGQSWDELDRRESNSDLNSAYAVKMFSVSDSKPKSKSGPFQMIRLRQIGSNHNNYHYLIFTAFEIFGSLIGLE